MTEFGKGTDGRPQGTSVVFVGENDERVIHYTCNSPSLAVLAVHGIMAIGRGFGVAAREVLLFPIRLFWDRGVAPGTAEAEAILTQLDGQ